MSSRNQPEGAPESAATEAPPSAAFTAGPWTLDVASCFIGDKTAPPGWTGVTAGRWGDLALVVTRLADDPFDLPEGVANARLIAAAPDLYEALRDLEQLVQAVAPAYAESTVAANARAALAKAGGQ